MHTNKPKMIKIVSLSVMAVCIIIMALSFVKPGLKPSYTCAAPGEPSSYFTDKSQDNCRISAESFKRANEWERGIYGEYKGLINRTTAVIFLLSLVGLITGVVMGKKAKKATQ